MNPRSPMIKIIKEYFDTRSIDFLNLVQIRKRLYEISLLEGDEFYQAFLLFASQLIEVLKILLSNNSGDAKRALSVKQLVITTPVTLTINVEDFLLLSELKKAFKPNSKASLERIHRDFMALPNLHKQSVDEEKLLATAKAELDNLTVVESKVLSILEKFDTDMQTLYQSSFSYLFSGLFRAVCAPISIDSNEQKFKLFTRKILRSSIPLNSVFMLGTYTTTKSIINQLYAMVSSPLQTIRSFMLEEDNEDNLPAGLASAKQAIRSALNADLAQVILELAPLKLESHFKTPAVFTGQQQVLNRNNKAEISLVHNKKLIRRSTQKSSGLEQLKDCTVICSEIKQEDLPKTNKFCQLTLINDDDYLITIASITFKIARLYNLMSIAKHIFKDTPDYLHLPSPTLSKTDLSLQFTAAIEDKSALLHDIQTLQGSMQTEEISFAKDSVWIAVCEKASELSMSPLQVELESLEDDNQKGILELHDKLASFLQNLRTRSMHFKAYEEKYESNLNLAISVNEKFDSYPQDLQTVEVKLATLKTDFAKLEQEKKWLDRSRQPLTEIAAAFLLLESKLKLIAEYHEQCPMPINCNDLQRQFDVMTKIKFEFNSLNTNFNEIASMIEGQRILLANSDLSDQKIYAANSNRFDFSAGSAQTVRMDSKTEKKEAPAKMRM